MPLKSFEIRNRKSLGFVKCDPVPPIMIIAGPNGVGKSTLLYSIKTKEGGSVDHTGRFLYIPPHRIWTKQAIRARFLWEDRKRYEEATETNSLSGVDGVRITSGSRTPDSSDESTKFIKFSLGQIEVQRSQAITALVDKKSTQEDLENLPDVYESLKHLTRTLLPHLDFYKIDTADMNNVKVLWKRSEGLDPTKGDAIEIDIDDLSSGEKAILTLFMPFIEYQMEKEMEKRKEKCSKNHLESETIVSVGNVAEIILDIVKEKKIDLIVMAKRRKLKGVKKLLSLGSVSRKIVEHVKCPVVLVDIENL